MKWGWSLLIPLSLLLWLLTWLLAPDDPGLTTIRVESQVTGLGLADARIVVGDVAYRADEDGEIRIEPFPDGTQVRVSAAGHESMQRPIEDGSAENVTLSLAGVLVLGSVSDAISGQPVDGAEIVVIDADGTEVTSTRTDESGTFVFKFIPEDSSLVVQHELYGDMMEPRGDQRTIGIEMDPPPVTGRVVDAQGQGVAGVEIVGPEAETVSGDGGSFTLNEIGQGSEVVIRHEGREVRTLTVEGADLGDIQLEASTSTPEAGE